MSVIKRRVKIGVVGTGWWATYTHIPALLARSEVELVALCDRSLEKVRRAAEGTQILYGLAKNVRE
jgi:predicted dehydrogenase